MRNITEFIQMANNHIVRCTVSVSTREMLVKITRRNQLFPPQKKNGVLERWLRG